MTATLVPAPVSLWLSTPSGAGLPWFAVIMIISDAGMLLGYDETLNDR